MKTSFALIPQPLRNSYTVLVGGEAVARDLSLHDGLRELNRQRDIHDPIDYPDGVEGGFVCHLNRIGEEVCHERS